MVVVQALSEYTPMLGEEVMIDPDEFMFAFTLIALYVVIVSANATKTSEIISKTKILFCVWTLSG